MQVKAGSDRAEGVVLIDPATGEGYAAGGGSGGGLTDAQLRASPVTVSAAALTNIDADLGATSDAAATNDTGTFSLIALVKRGLQNWATLLGRIPALVSGRIPVEGPVTDTQLRATAVPVAPNITRGAGVVDANTQRFTLASDGPAVTSLANIDSDLGAPADAAATTDTGTFSLIALVKRALTNWTTLLGRVPASVGGRMPVDGSGVTQPVSAASLPLPAGAATEATLSAQNAKMPVLIGGRTPVEPLGIPGTARQVATTTSNANTVLTAGVGRISIFARLAPLRYSVGSAAQTANAATSHYLAAGERIDIDVPATPNIAVIRASDATADGAAEITELS